MEVGFTVARGRDQFERLESVLTSSEAVVGVLPFGVRRKLFDSIRNLQGRVGIAARYVLLRRLTASCGRVVAVFEGVYLRNTEQLRLGDHVSIHPMCYFDALGGLEIGSNVSIAHGTTIMTTEHDYDAPDSLMREAPVKPSPVKIGSDVWIGAGVKILAGVTVGDHVVVGAGAVVTKDIPSNSVAVGVPARVVKRLETRS